MTGWWLVVVAVFCLVCYVVAGVFMVMAFREQAKADKAWRRFPGGW